MEDLLKTKNLGKKEKLNVFLATACGCLEEIYQITPGPAHSKKKRMVLDARLNIMKGVAPVLPRVARHNMDLFLDTIKSSEKILKDILEESKTQREHILLNLASFCLNELPLKDKHWRKFNPLFDLWNDAYKYKDIKSGERIFLRIDAEVQILVAQRGGVLL